MGDELVFDVRLARRDGFALEVKAAFPLAGITVISGPSGCGKTTLLRGLAGLERFDAGTVRFGDAIWQSDRQWTPPETRRVGFVFQDAGLFPHLSVADNLAYGARRRDVTQYGAIVEALDLGDLLPRAVPGLSGGEMRRVALGRALASDPAVLFLDEPLSGLDHARKEELMPYIGRAVAEARVPAVYVTHSRAEVAALGDRVMGMEAGRLTGWAAASHWLMARVTHASGSTIRAEVIGAPNEIEAGVSLPRIAEVGETVRLGFRAEAMMLSVAEPGRSDALLQVPALIADVDGRPKLDVFGQIMDLPRGGPHAIGAQVWLSVLEISPRPEASDSADSRR